MVAFVAGARWARARGAWVDHRDQRAKERRLRKARWAPWRDLAWPLGALAVLLVIVAAAGRN